MAPEDRHARALTPRVVSLAIAHCACAVFSSAGSRSIARWAATIDFTPDHLPIIAPGYDTVFVASAGGAGMMWGPAVGRAVADISRTGTTPVGDTTDLGLDRFGASGRSRLAADPIALPFPEKTS